MRKLPLIVTAGAFILAGTAAFAAGDSNLHTMTVTLPDGGVAKIEYLGNVAPKVDIAHPPGAFAPFEPGFAVSGFPDFAKIEAAMDRQMSDMLRYAGALMAMPAMPNTPFEANSGAVPGASSSWFISTGNGADFCARSVEVTVANGKRTVRSHTQGDCGPANGSAVKEHATAAPAKSI